jgi:tetratricopeptide (TPR) repeat protein
MVFISHSTKDDRVVADIRKALERLGVEVWTDSQRLAGGDLLTPTVKDAISRASHVLAILSTNAVNSPWVRKEIDHALDLKKKVIPVLLPGIEPTALGLWFREEPVGVELAIGPGGVSAALPSLLVAVDEMAPGEIVASIRADLAPIADLVLELGDPGISTADGVRRASATARLIYRPADGGRDVEGRRYRFTAPLGPIEAEDLTWYLERYVNWPSGVFQERARGIEANLQKWGRSLFDTLNTDAARNALEAWKAAPSGAERRFTVKVDRELMDATDERQADADEGATLLLALPWELIHDGEGYLFQGARGVRVRRSLPSRNPQQALATEPPIRVLLVSPRPEDESAGYIDHRSSAKPVVEALTALGELAEFKVLEPPTFTALQRELKSAPYHVVHFDGHGVYDRNHGLGALCFEDPADEGKVAGRRSQLVTADKIAEVIRDHRVPLMFLDACQTAKAAADPSASVAGKLLESGVGSVTAMSHSVLVETARRFVSEFYRDLMGGKRVGQAMLSGQRALKADTFRGKVFTGDLHLEDWFVPVLFQEELDPQLVREIPAESIRAIAGRGRQLALGKIPEEPQHTFVGRSRQLLAAERVLSREEYVVLRGAGGEGKTAIAAELARWLVLTRRFDRGAFVALDQSGDARKMLYAIGDQLVPNYASRAGQDQRLEWQLVDRPLGEQTTVIVIDNVESVLEPPAGSEAAALFEAEVLKEILDLCRRLAETGRTRLIFTSREAIPEPFSGNVLKIGRLDKWEAIRLVGEVLGKGDLMPHAADAGESEAEVEALVEAVGCHARSLVLLAREVAASGVRHATERIRDLMAKLETEHPGDRERSLLASAELSLGRLPAQTRRRIRPLSVFHGGASLFGICLALKLQPELAVSLVRELENVGIAEMGEFGYVRFDPALLGELDGEEREAARVAWSEAMAAEVEYLYRGTFEKDAHLALNIALLDLANLVSALEYLARVEPPERVIAIATSLEALIAELNRQKALARVVEIRTGATGPVSDWSHPRYRAEQAAVERLLERGRHEEAVQAAGALHARMQAAGKAAYEEAAYDAAAAQFTLGRALLMSGAAGAALGHLEEARRRFQSLGEVRAANVAVVDSADCLIYLGRYDEAAGAYEESIRVAAQLGDARQRAVIRSQLATVRMLQKRYVEALNLYAEVRKTFQELGESRYVAATWYQIGLLHQKADQYEAAEGAYQESLKIDVQLGNLAGEARTLIALGTVYSLMGRLEEAVRFYRPAAEVFVSLRDLRMEGAVRNNIAYELVKLKRYDEARVEVERAIECGKPFGHVGEPWKTFNNLSDLEREVGNGTAARQARNQAIQAYTAYRRAGGESQSGVSALCSSVVQHLGALRQEADLTPSLRALIPAVEAVLAGSREVRLADDPNIDYDDAAELLLLIESLPAQATGAG